MSSPDHTAFGVSAGEAGGAEYDGRVEEERFDARVEEERVMERLRDLKWPTVPPDARERGWERLQRALAGAQDGAGSTRPLD